MNHWKPLLPATPGTLHKELGGGELRLNASERERAHRAGEARAAVLAVLARDLAPADAGTVLRALGLWDTAVEMRALTEHPPP